MKKITAENYLDAEYYLEQFLDRDNWSDINIMYDKDIDLIAHELVGMGSIDSRFCGKENEEIEKIVEAISKKFAKLPEKQKNKRINAVFKNVHISDCQECNHVNFLDYGNEDLYGNDLNKCNQCNSENVLNYKFDKPEIYLKWNGKKWTPFNSKVIKERLNIK